MSIQNTSFSIIMPMDTDRLKQFEQTKRAYDQMAQKKEFIIPTRSFDKLSMYLDLNDLMKDVRLIPYKIDQGFNCSKALNLGVKHATYDNIVITSPEVRPVTNVLAQFEKSLGRNLICMVDDENEGGILTPLVYKGYRSDTPAMYFLALFNKADIETINGWDEEFMRGYAYEDNDFGDRWKRAGLPFEVREDIKAVHQYHKRSETIVGGSNINYNLYQQNTAKGVIKPLNGLQKL
jgi:hypothetical protein